jgi:hypothetical protein
MPQIDFAQAFTVPAATKPSPVQFAPDQGWRPDPEEVTASPRFISGRGLSQSGWANITFVSVASAGAIFCAFYFFNAADLLRAAAAWPREFLYSRPFASNPDKIDNPIPPSEGVYRSEEPSTSSGHPFARTPGPSALNQPPPLASAFANNPGSFSGPPGSVASSLISGLGVPAPGGDTLSQTFNQAVSDLQHATELNTRRTVVVVQTAATAETKRRIKNSQQRAQTAVSNATTQSGQVASSTTSTAQTQASSTVRSTTTTTQNTLNRVTNLPSRPMSGLGGGGLGGGGGLHAPSLGGRR